MDFSKLIDSAKAMGWALPAGALGVAALVVVAVALVRKRKEIAKKLQPALVAISKASPKRDGSRLLAQAWQRFSKRLPADHRRSLVRFEHFLVLGGAPASRVRLMSRHADGLEFMRQLVGDDKMDPDLPVAITPGAVLISLPSDVLEDESGKGRTALQGLARVAFKSVHPVAVLVVDAGWLREADSEARSDFVRVVRDKLLLLNKMRRRTVEVRIALDGLGVLPGASEAVQLCQREGIALQIRPRRHEAATEASDWLAELVTQIPRALVGLKSDEFRAYVAFCRSAPEVMRRLDGLLDDLFAERVAGTLLAPGGIFLSSDVVSSPGPFVSRGEQGRADPLRMHRLKASCGAAALCALLGTMYGVHRADWAEAVAAFESVRQAPESFFDVNDARKVEERAKISAFTQRNRWWSRAFPDPFFGAERAGMRRKFSAQLRAKVLVPGLREAMRGNIVDAHRKMTLRWRRAVVFLALLHSDAQDLLNLRDDDRRDLVSRFTTLPEGFVREYLDNTDEASWDSLASFLVFSKEDPRDRIEPWQKFATQVEADISDGVITKTELATLHSLAEPLQEALPRFDYDQKVVKLRDDLEILCRRAPDRISCKELMAEYASVLTPKDSGKGSAVARESGRLEHLLSLVRGAHIAGAATHQSLSEFTNRLSGLAAPARASELIQVALTSTVTISVPGWNAAVLEGTVDELLAAFQPPEDAPDEMFFDPDDESRLPSVRWAGGAAFPVSAMWPTRFTRVAYDDCIRRKLEDLLKAAARIRMSQRSKTRLLAKIRPAIVQYAEAYENAANRFVEAPALALKDADDVESVLSDLASESSAFDQFLAIVDENTNLDTAPSAKHAKVAVAEAERPDGGADGGSDGGTDDHGAVVAEEETQALTAPLLQVTREFAPWRAARKDAAAYKKLVQEALKAFGESGEDSAKAKGGGAEPAARKAPALLSELSPLGLVGLEDLRGDAKAISHKVHNWVTGVRLPEAPEAHARAFTFAFEALVRLGQHEVRKVVGQAWLKIRPGVADAATKFPFARTARTGISPDDFSALFDPTTGLVPQFVHGYLEPLLPADAGHNGQIAEVLRSLGLEDEVKQVIQASAVLGQRLWDDKGVSRKLVLQFKPEPFEGLDNADVVATEIALQLGPRSVRYFNQTPVVTAAEVDWTVDENAQLTVAYVNINEPESPHEASLPADAPYWRSLRVLARAKMSKVGGLRPTARCEWTLQASTPKGPRRVSARLLVQGDPWAGFDLSDIARAGSGWP
jgi:hypothetical protein